MTQLDTLVDSRADRDRHAGRVDVLDKVKALLLLPDDAHATTDMVAAYYEVPVDTIRSVTKNNRDELDSDGFKVIAGAELRSLKDLSGIASRSPSLALFPRRAILRVGMLLQGSDIARRVRDELLNIEQASRQELGTPSFDMSTTEGQIAFAAWTVGVLQAKQKLELTAAAQSAELKTTRPKANFVDYFVNPTDDATTVRVFAQQIGMTETGLRDWLQDRKLIYRRFVEKRWSKSKRAMVDEWQWLPHAAHATWFVVRDQPTAPRLHNGQLRTTLYVTAVGKEKIRELLAKRPAAIEAAPPTRALEAS